jgi:hypothetical protein
MQVFEPTSNFGEEVFEPTVNFGENDSKYQRDKKGVDELSKILKSNDLSNSQKDKIQVAVSTGGVFAGLYLANRFFDNNKKSDFAGVIIAKAVGDTMQGVGKIADAGARRKEAESRIKELGGKRIAEKESCAKNPAFKKFLDKKYRNNRIKECQAEVDKRIDKDEAEAKEIQRQMIELEKSKIDVSKISLQTASSDKELDVKSKNKRNLILGLSIGGGVLILGTILVLVLRKNK